MPLRPLGVRAAVAAALFAASAAAAVISRMTACSCSIFSALASSTASFLAAVDLRTFPRLVRVGSTSSVRPSRRRMTAASFARRSASIWRWLRLTGSSSPDELREEDEDRRSRLAGGGAEGNEGAAVESETEGEEATVEPNDEE